MCGSIRPSERELRALGKECKPGTLVTHITGLPYGGFARSESMGGCWLGRVQGMEEIEVSAVWERNTEGWRDQRGVLVPGVWYPLPSIVVARIHTSTGLKARIVTIPSDSVGIRFDPPPSLVHCRFPAYGRKLFRRTA